jgi:hypothetical protein
MDGATNAIARVSTVMNRTSFCCLVVCPDISFVAMHNKVTKTELGQSKNQIRHVPGVPHTTPGLSP